VREVLRYRNLNIIIKYFYYLYLLYLPSLRPPYSSLNLPLHDPCSDPARLLLLAMPVVVAPGGGTADAEELFRTKRIPEIRAGEGTTRREISSKEEELLLLVGRSYRDLLDSADSIILIKQSSDSISDNLSRISGSLSPLSLRAHVAVLAGRARQIPVRHTRAHLGPAQRRPAPVASTETNELVSYFHLFGLRPKFVLFFLSFSSTISSL
jgi:hypothetical protein